ncbi:MAG TPA: hypothetical protein VIO94_16120 [Phenylobacterium sp.]
MGDFAVNLTAEEALRLDGACRPDVQAIVDRAKTALQLRSSGLSEKEGAMVATILTVAKEKGRLTYDRSPITRCPCCGRHDGYHTYSRAGRYHRKGQPNYSAPKTFMGFDLNRGFVTVQHHISVGYCTDCRGRVEAVLLPLLADERVDCPDHWAAAPHRFRRFDNKTCTACGWEGHEGQMRPRRTLMGDGTYPGGCPNCPAENAPLSRAVIVSRDGFTLVERQAPKAPTPGDQSASAESDASVVEREGSRDRQNPSPPTQQEGEL